MVLDENGNYTLPSIKTKAELATEKSIKELVDNQLLANGIKNFISARTGKVQKLDFSIPSNFEEKEANTLGDNYKKSLNSEKKIFFELMHHLPAGSRIIHIRGLPQERREELANELGLPEFNEEEWHKYAPEIDDMLVEEIKRRTRCQWLKVEGLTRTQVGRFAEAMHRLGLYR